MSTVDKKTADDVVNGKYPSDPIKAIIKYQNMFDGADAYKLVYDHQHTVGVMASICCKGAPKIYWERKGDK